MPEYHLSHLGGKLMSTQVSALLIRELKEGAYAQAERLPSEVELSEQIGVSRTVIRDALSDLEREGLIERVRGIGTVINACFNGPLIQFFRIHVTEPLLYGKK